MQVPPTSKPISNTEISSRDLWIREIRNCFIPILYLMHYRISRIRPDWDLKARHQIKSPPKGTAIIICGFGDAQYQDAAKRLALQAKRSNFFEQIFCFTSLAQVLGMDSQQVSKYREFAKDNPRGYGLWAWKPAVIAAVMSRVPEEISVFYLDSGCEISSLGLDRYLSYLKAVKSLGSIFFSIPFREYEWTASSVLKRFGRPLIDNSYQVQAGSFALKNSSEWRHFVRNWADYCLENNGALLNPSLSIADRFMISHREDQSILSCMLKQGGKGNIRKWEDHFHPDLYHKNSWILLMPIHTLRSRKKNKRSVIDQLLVRSDITACLDNVRKSNGKSLLLILSMTARFLKEALFSGVKAILITWRAIK